MTQPFASTSLPVRAPAERAAPPSDRAATALLSAAAFFFAVSGHLLTVAREPLLLTSGDSVYRDTTNLAVRVLCALAVPVYGWSLRRSSRARVSLALVVVMALAAAEWSSPVR